MPDYLKALPVILVLAATVFTIAKSPACAVATAADDYIRRRNVWFAVTLIAFLAHNYWLYIAAAAIVLHVARRREPNPLAMYFLVLCAVPPIALELRLGVPLFDMHYYRLLSLVVLLPAFLHLRKQPDSVPFGRLFPDKLLIAYILLQIVLIWPLGTVTNTVRQGIVLAFIDVVLPYYVASRSIKDMQGFRDALMALAVAALVLSMNAMFEYGKQWLLYSDLVSSLNVRWFYGKNYTGRGGELRAVATLGQPIALGYTVFVALGLFLYLGKSIPNKTAWGLGLLLLAVGIYTPLSRGPWVGAAVMLLVFIAIGPSPVVRFVKLGLLGLFALPLVMASPLGEKIIDRLPFIGTIGAENVEYRKALLEATYICWKRNPWIGSYDFIDSSEMQALRQGEGIIDLTNNYATILLTSGAVGLSLFLGFFLVIMFGIYKIIRGLPDKHSELFLLGQVLISVLAGIMVTIFTVAPIINVAIIYWTMGGLGVAYARIAARASSPAAAKPDSFQLRGAKIGNRLKSPIHAMPIAAGRDGKIMT